MVCVRGRRKIGPLFIQDNASTPCDAADEAYKAYAQ